VASQLDRLIFDGAVGYSYLLLTAYTHVQGYTYFLEQDGIILEIITVLFYGTGHNLIHAKQL